MVKNPSDNKWLSALCNISSLSGDTRLVSCCSPNTKKAPESFSGIISQPFFAEKKKRCLHHSWKVTSFPFYEVQWPNLNHSTNESLNSQPQTEPLVLDDWFLVKASLELKKEVTAEFAWFIKSTEVKIIKSRDLLFVLNSSLLVKLDPILNAVLKSHKNSISCYERKTVQALYICIYMPSPVKRLSSSVQVSATVSSSQRSMYSASCPQIQPLSM